MINIISDDPDFIAFAKELQERESMQPFFKQLGTLSDADATKIIRIIKSIEDAEDAEDGNETVEL